MKKILLIEDRTERQNLFINDTKITLNEYDNILDNRINEKYHSFVEAIKNDAFSLDSYAVIIAHKSAFENDNTSIIQKLEKHCKNHQKTLVFFSGGIDCNYYLEEDNYKIIEVSSKTLYSQNIKLFLENFRKGNNNPLILSYGKKWKINILLNVLEKINYLLETNERETIFYEDFTEDCNIEMLDTLDIKVYKPVLLNSQEISKVEIVKFRDNLLNHIQNSSF